MFTVKTIDRKGVEHLYIADTIKFVPDSGDQESFGTAGLYLDPETDPAGIVQFAKHCFPASRCASATDVATPMAYIMNQHGATVASYRL